MAIWKVDLAKRVKQRLLSEGPKSHSPDVIDRWEKLFNTFQTARVAATVATSKTTTI